MVKHMGMGYVVDWDLEYNKDICTIYKCPFEVEKRADRTVPSVEG